MEAGTGGKNSLEAAPENSFSIAAELSHWLQGCFLPLCWSMSISVFPMRKRKASVPAPRCPHHAAASAPAGFHAHPSKPEAASWCLCDSILAESFAFSSSAQEEEQEEEQDTMEQSCSEKTLLQRCRMQEGEAWSV